MMRLIILLTMAMVIVACDADPAGNIDAKGVAVRAQPERWKVQRIWPILDAQEQRDVDALCILMKSAAPEVREAAALAFASVQDTAGIPCLLEALNDGLIGLRINAVYSLGFVADGQTLERMAEAARSETDSTVLRAHRSASFIAMQRNGMLDPSDMIDMLMQGTPFDRIRAADAIRRLPDSVLTKYQHEIEGSMPVKDPEVGKFLLQALAKMEGDTARVELRRIAVAGEPMQKVNAIQALGATATKDDVPLFIAALADPVTCMAALEQIERNEAISGKVCLEEAEHVYDRRARIRLLGLAIQRADQRTANKARTELDAIDSLELGAYEEAEMIRSRYSMPSDESLEELIAIMHSDRSAPEKQAAFQMAVLLVRDRMSRSKFTDRESEYAELKKVVQGAMTSDDAGLICAAAEELLKEETNELMLLYSSELARKAGEQLEGLKDLEARQLLDRLWANRYDLPPPAHQPPDFNHPIDKKRLIRLEQGQQYRITTNKGEIMLATSVNEAPGTSLAFDSLVTAGYYDGKSFHRVVPNFVVQGGCPRGDGYGGMPWTLRTEIGTTPFTAGSVGMASAGPDTESCQFFITHSATPHLDGRYTRFAEVISGMDVVYRLTVGDVMEKVEKIK